MAFLRQTGRAGLALAATFVIWLGLEAAGFAAQPTTPAEYQLKAVFLFNFTQFVEWPSEAFAGPEAPFVIGVLGNDPFGGYLEETVSDEKINGRQVQVRRYKTAAEIGMCHILFISGSETNRLREILPRLVNRPVLTVSDADGFTGTGGIIQFFTENNRIRLRVNIDTAKGARLTISSKLLRSADVVPKRSS